MYYKTLYDKIIRHRKQTPPRGYTETHHILPKSLGGSEDEDNLVKLSAREHFICHYLLTKMYEVDTPEWYKLNNAFLIMRSVSATQKRYVNAKMYENSKEITSKIMSKLQSGHLNSQFGTKWICNVQLRKNRKIKKNEEIPDGWVAGRNVWNSFGKCIVCDEAISSKTAKWCKTCKAVHDTSRKQSVFRATKTKRYYSDDEKLSALKKCNGNIRQALYMLGLNDSGWHYKRMKELKNKM